MKDKKEVNPNISSSFSSNFLAILYTSISSLPTIVKLIFSFLVKFKVSYIV